MAKRKATPSPEAAAQAKFDRILYFYGKRELEAEVRAALSYMKSFTVPREHVHLTCRAGRSGFWMAWTGDLLPCGIFSGPKISLLDHTFAESWKYIVKEAAKLEMHAGCAVCKKRFGCIVCGASCLAESGGMTKKPEYLCKMKDAYYRLLLPYVQPEAQDEFLKLLGE